MMILPESISIRETSCPALRAPLSARSRSFWRKVRGLVMSGFIHEWEQEDGQTRARRTARAARLAVGAKHSAQCTSQVRGGPAGRGLPVPGCAYGEPLRAKQAATSLARDRFTMSDRRPSGYRTRHMPGHFRIGNDAARQFLATEDRFSRRNFRYCFNGLHGACNACVGCCTRTARSHLSRACCHACCNACRPGFSARPEGRHSVPFAAIATTLVKRSARPLLPRASESCRGRNLGVLADDRK
jgi:hypothetical protein